jgi:hypothetical protein
MCVLKRFVLIFALAALFVSPVLPKNDGFSGKWIIDKTASTASFDIPDQLTQEIKTKASNLVIMTTWREPQNGMAPLGLLGIMTTNLRLNLSGQDETNEIGPFKQVSKTTQSGNQLITDYNAANASTNGEQVSGRWTRTLSGDGRQMTLEITQTSGSQSNQAKLVFNRK